MGNRTECGLLQMAAGLGADYEEIRRQGRVLRSFPFSSERKRMTSLTAQPGGRCVVICPLAATTCRMRAHSSMLAPLEHARAVAGIVYWGA